MRSKGFTLIELLTVVSLTGILLAILLPALGAARKQGRAVCCLSNLRQLALAAELYTSSNDGYYPIAYMYARKDSRFISYAWDFTTIRDWSEGEQKVIPGLLWQGQTIEKIHQCPSFKGPHNWLNDPYTGYNYNTSYIGHGQLESIETPANTDQIIRPGNCALFGDGGYISGANKFMRAPRPNPGDLNFSDRYAGTQDYRHLGATNVAYCDGSTKSVRKLYTDTDKWSRDKIAKGTGFLSPDNSAYDLK
jgi:prepilin-type N-terminal cleavage/methylation domain-containing protein/prepilin-type processing-associated H-X9-DG protein